MGAIRAYFRSQRSQSMVEFAMIAPVLLLIVFGIVDLGRVLYFYVTIQQAASEGARVAVRFSTPLPADDDVETAVKNHAIDMQLGNPCKNGPITSTAPPPNRGWIFITQPSPDPSPVTTQPIPYNAPGGEPPAVASGSCSAINPGAGHAQLQVTIQYNFVPITPLIQSAAANQIVIQSSAVYRTEY
jgi:TadE-like protein